MISYYRKNVKRKTYLKPILLKFIAAIELLWTVNLVTVLFFNCLPVIW